MQQSPDEGKTGTNLNRAGWKELLADAQDGLFDVVFVTYMSRLARGEAYHVAEYLLKEAGVRIELVQENFTPDLAGHVNKQMTILMDGMYPKMVSQWTKTKQQQMVERGYFTGGIYPFGYRTEPVTDAGGFHKADKEPPRRLVPHPDEAPHVRRAFEILVETRRVADVLDYLRSMVPSRKWRFDNVIYLLRNEVYRGVLRFGEWVNHTAHEPIVSEALWDMAREVDSIRSCRAAKRNPVDEYPYYLRGLVWCPHCDCRMTPVWGHGRSGTITRYYECMLSKKKLTVCPVRRVNAETLHASVFGEIERAAQHPTRMTELIREAVKELPKPTDLTRRVADTSRQLREVEKRIARIQDAIEQGTGGAVRSQMERLEALEAERVRLSGQQTQLETEAEAQRIRRPDVAEACRLWGRLTELYEAATDEEREEILQALVVRVEMTEKEEGTCEVSLLPQVPARWIEPTLDMGAEKARNSTIVGFVPLRAGRSIRPRWLCRS
jgi:site-specific DNA recombinase